MPNMAVEEDGGASPRAVHFLLPLLVHFCITGDTCVKIR